MNPEAHQLLNETPLCLEILQSYEEKTRQQTEEQNSKWQTRIAAEEQSASESSADEDTPQSKEWSSAHGLLIAYGLLDIGITSREAGIQYCLTTDGKQLLKQWQQLQQAEMAKSA